MSREGYEKIKIINLYKFSSPILEKKKKQKNFNLSRGRSKKNICVSEFSFRNRMLKIYLAQQTKKFDLKNEKESFIASTGSNSWPI